MEIDFYDKVARKFGNYSSGVEIEKEFTNGDPEAAFKNELLRVSGPEIEALDVGCADGRFTLSVAPYFKKIWAIDISEGMLSYANKLKEQTGVSNVTFKNVDIHKNNFLLECFDLIYCRRGPTDYQTFESILVPGGYYVEIGIGEQDARDIKEVFGRGQGYEKWNKPVLEKDIIELMGLRFNIICAGEYKYMEYYKNSADLSRFLESVPIFTDYDPVADRDHLARYIATHKTEKGIALPRHRIVLVGQKK